MQQDTVSDDLDFVLTAEASRILHKSSETVRAWERRGILKAVKTRSGVRLFPRREVKALARKLAREREASAAQVA